MAERGGVTYALADGAVLVDAHLEGECWRPGACPLHTPSDHPLRGAPLVSYPPTSGLGRRCQHGQAHPDPDDVAYRERAATHYPGRRPGWLHEPCDGCCGMPL